MHTFVNFVLEICVGIHCKTSDPSYAVQSSPCRELAFPSFFLPFSPPRWLKASAAQGQVVAGGPAHWVLAGAGPPLLFTFSTVMFQRCWVLGVTFNCSHACNVIISTYNDALMGDVQVGLEKGTVAFGSGLRGWVSMSWGDNKLNPKKKTWTNVQQLEECDKPLQRAVCQFIMCPIAQLMRATFER